MSKSIGIGVIGPGGRIHSVVSLLRRIAGAVEVRGLCGVEPDSFLRWRRILAPGALTTLDQGELLARPDIDWVFIGSFNCFHAEHAIAALRAGKHVFCEKPLATTLEDCLAIREAVRASGRTFAFGLVLRYAPIYQQVRHWIDQGRLGRIISFEFNETLRPDHGGYIMGNWRRHRKLAGTHVLEKTCHDLDLANWFTDSVPVRAASFGGLGFFTPENAELGARIGGADEGGSLYESWPDANRVDPFGADKDINDHQVTILEYASGARATFHTNCHTSLPERRFYILGTEGAIRADCVAGTADYIMNGDMTLRHTITFPGSDLHGSGDTVMAGHLARVLLEGAEPLAGVEEGLRSAIAAFGIDQAADTGTVVDLRPLWRQAGIELPEPGVRAGGGG